MEQLDLTTLGVIGILFYFFIKQFFQWLSNGKTDIKKDVNTELQLINQKLSNHIEHISQDLSRIEKHIENIYHELEKIKDKGRNQ